MVLCSVLCTCVNVPQGLILGFQLHFSIVHKHRIHKWWRSAKYTFKVVYMDREGIWRNRVTFSFIWKAKAKTKTKNRQNLWTMVFQGTEYADLCAIRSCWGELCACLHSLPGGWIQRTLGKSLTNSLGITKICEELPSTLQPRQYIQSSGVWRLEVYRENPRALSRLPWVFSW